MNSPRHVLGLALVALVALSAAAPAAPTANLNTPDYHIVTDAAHTNLNTGDFDMPHKVRLTRPGTDAVADSARGNSKRGTATLTGNVVVHDSGNAPEAVGADAYKGSGPATLTCDSLDIDTKARLYTAVGHVHFTQGTTAGSADRAVLNRASGSLHLEGNVHLSQNGSTLTSQTVDYNLNTKDAEVHGNPTEMTQPANQPPPAATSRPASTKPKPKPKPQPKPTPTRRP